MRWNWTRALPLLAAAVGLLGGLEPTAGSELYINEVFLDPPGSSDNLSEYIELRGTPGMSLDNHYLIFIENEDNATHTGNAGLIDSLYNLSSVSMGSNGFLTIRYREINEQTGAIIGNNPYSVAPGATDVIATNVDDDPFKRSLLENSGFTAMLVNTNGLNLPTVGFDLDGGNNGLDVATGRAGWSILDSIGIHSEEGEAEFGRLYGQINFGPEPTASVEPGATYVGLGYEIEYLGRWGNSTGQTAADWHISNLTNDALSGYTGMGDFRQSGEPHGIGAPGQFVETNQGVPYGTNLTGTLGARNIPEPGSIALATLGAGSFLAVCASRMRRRRPCLTR